VMYGELPTEAVISASQAEQIAIDYLLSYGMDDIINLIPYSRYLTIDNQCQYTVFFARLDNGQIAPIYSVIVDAKTGEVLSTFDPTANGLG